MKSLNRFMVLFSACIVLSVFMHGCDSNDAVVSDIPVSEQTRLLGVYEEKDLSVLFEGEEDLAKNDALISNISIPVDKNAAESIESTDIPDNIILTQQAETTYVTEADTVSENAGISEIADTDSSYSYVLNKNTRKFHYPSCNSVKQIKDKNKGTGNNRDLIISQGYQPCKRCNP